MPKATPKGRRQPKAEDFPVLFDLVAQGRSMASACEAHGIDAPSVSKAIYADEVLEADYQKAREARGDYYAERIISTADAVLTDEVKPDAARVAIDAYKWTAARMAPKRWGEKVALEHTGKDGADLAPFVVQFVKAGNDDGQ